MGRIRKFPLHKVAQGQRKDLRKLVAAPTQQILQSLPNLYREESDRVA